jgi:elongation of very long chain fatty acids protein 6
MDFVRAFEIEHRFSGAAASKWMSEWWTLSLWLAGVYAVLVHWGKSIMKDRTKFVLRRELFLWNLTLAAFSIIGLCRIGGRFVEELWRDGWYETACRVDWMDGSVGLWSYLFGMSKLPELIDTLFVVLRKQKLSFLHWYHHMTVFCYCWYSYGSLNGYTRVFAVLNYFVHALMYTYYAIRIQGIVKIPLIVSIAITSLQIIQMIIGVAVTIYMYFIVRNGVPCHAEYTNVSVALAMYLSYAILFIHFFYVNYVKKEKIKST